MLISFWTLLQVILVLVLLYFYIRKKYSYWSDRGVKGPRPVFPFGYMHTKVLNRPDEIETKWLKEYGKVYGLYTGMLPTLTISDSELIKQVLVKDFAHFVNHRHMNSYDAIWNHNLFLLEDDDWKRVRSITSPAFTSGKLRGMIPLMAQCINKLTNYLDENIAASNGVIDTKEVIYGFTIDVIASTSFATETNANDDRSKKNAFVHHAMNFSKLNPAKGGAIMIFPRIILNALNITHFFQNDAFDFFVQLSSRILNARKGSSDGTPRSDLVQLMMDTFAYEDDLAGDDYYKLTASMEHNDTEDKVPDGANQNKVKKMLNEKEIIAQCVLFFFAGFETTAALITHAIFEMAHNPSIQDRLVEQIKQVSEGVDQTNLLPTLTNQPTAYFDKFLNHVPYLDAVVKETLRKYPPVVRLERRVCANNVKLGDIPLDKGVLIEIPTYAVHHNPEYYPEPAKFLPDRFLLENKHLLVPYTYIPFGHGPRNCIGMRFAYQEAKLCLAQIVQRYRFSPTTHTPAELTFAKGSQLLYSSPFQVKVLKR